jgi:hypothetical protein
MTKIPVIKFKDKKINGIGTWGINTGLEKYELNKERKIEFRGTYDPEDPPIIFNDSEFVFRVFRGGNNG